MPGFRCGVCDRLHDHLPRDLGYRRPASYFSVPEHERVSRVQENDDLCIIDGSTFLIRGVLYLPIRESDEQFGWGVWARVGEGAFKRYLDAWRHNTEDQVDPFPGWLSGNVGPYEGSDGLEVAVVLVPRERPRFTVRSELHPLGVDQRRGISEEKAHGFVAPYS